MTYADHYYWGSGRPASVSDNVDHDRALPTVRIIDPSSRMVSVRPNTITQPISDQYVIVLYPLTEQAMIKWYLADMRIH